MHTLNAEVLMGEVSRLCFYVIRCFYLLGSKCHRHDRILVREIDRTFIYYTCKASAFLTRNTMKLRYLVDVLI